MKPRYLLAALSLLLPSCLTPPLVGGMKTRDGKVKVYPDGRFEIVLEPRSSK